MRGTATTASRFENQIGTLPRLLHPSADGATRELPKASYRQGMDTTVGSMQYSQASSATNAV